AMTCSAHARVDQDLRHGIARGRRLFTQVGFVHRLNEVDGMVVRNELQSVSDALNQVVLLDHGHAARPLGGADTARRTIPTRVIKRRGSITRPPGGYTDGRKVKGCNAVVIHGSRFVRLKERPSWMAHSLAGEPTSATQSEQSG